jgi:hypothetical protein
MGSMLLRSLVLACSLTLALPPGWCCIFQAAQADDEPAPVGCCKSASHQAPKPQDDNEPPQPSHGSDCPCADRATTPVSKIDQLDRDVALPADVVALDGDVLLTSTRGDSAPALIVPPERLHLLQCCWLC